MEEKYEEFVAEVNKLVNRIKTLENEANNMYTTLQEKKHASGYRKLYYATMNQFEIYIDRIVEINCGIEIQPWEQMKDDLELVVDIPHSPNLGEQKYVMTYIDGDSPWNFWLSHTINLEEFQALQRSLWEKASTGLLQPITMAPIRGDYVCYLEGCRVCRGVITDVLKNRFKIVNVDTSAFKILPLEKLLKIDDEVTSLHALAMNCFLLESTNDDALLWTAELQKIFSSVLKSCKLMVEVIKRVEDVTPPSFLVKLVAIDSSVCISNCDDCDTVSVEEWVSKRILPELRANAVSDTKNELSICALDAFYENNSDVNEDNSCVFDEKNYDEKCVENSKTLPRVQETFQNEPQENSFDVTMITDNTVNASVSEDNTASVIIDDKKDFVLKEETQKQSDSDNLNEQKHYNDCDADYLLKTTINKRDDDVSSTSNRSDFSNCDNASSLSNFSNNLKPKFTFTNSAVQPKVKSVSSAVTSSNTATTNSIFCNTPMRPSFHPTSAGAVQHYYVGSHVNLHQANGVPNQHQPNFMNRFTKQISESPLMMLRQNYGYVQRPYKSDPYYAPTYKSGISPMQSSAVPSMGYWSRSVPPNRNYNFTSWSTGDKSAKSNGHTNFSNENPVNGFDGNIISKSDVVSESSSQLVNSGGIPASTYPELMKVELKHPISIINPDEEISAVISCVVSPDEIYVHLANENNIYIDRLQEDINNYYSVAQHFFIVNKEEGERLCGHYSACYCKINDCYNDDNFRWYRAEILSWDKDSEDVPVHLVDYGNKLRVGLSQIQPLAVQFGKYYMMAQRCHLSGVKCPDKGWPTSVCKYLSDLLAFKEDYSVTVVPSNDTIKNSLETVLYERNNKSSSINSRIKEYMRMYYRGEKDLDVDVKEQISEDAGGGDKNSNASVNNEEDQWDPMKEDFESERNNYKVDEDDPCVAVSGYKPKDEERLCKFFSKRGFCWKKSCKMEHIQNTDGVYTLDTEAVYQQAFNQINLPVRGSYIKLNVTNVLKANTFFAQIQNKMNSVGNKITYEDDDFEQPETLATLMKSLNKSSTIIKLEDAELPLIEGQLVIARADVGKKNYWFRARVNEVNDDGTCWVFFVDFGTVDIVFVRNIRAMHPKFLHLPFQAVECTLANVQLKEKAIDEEEPINLLKELIDKKRLNGVVLESYEGLQRLEVLLEDDDGCDIGNRLSQTKYYDIIEKKIDRDCDDDDDDGDNENLNELPG